MDYVPSEISRKQAKVIIERLDGQKEEFLTDVGSIYGITGIGYSFMYENGRQMIIHPNSIYKLIIEKIHDE